MPSTLTKFLGATAAAGAMAVTTAVLSPSAGAVIVDHSSSCPAGEVQLKLDRAPVVGDVISDGTLTIEITGVEYKAGESEAKGFTFTVLSGDVADIDVYVKGGKNVQFYEDENRTDPFYSPTKGGPGSGSKHFGISYVQFCYTPGGGSGGD